MGGLCFIDLVLDMRKRYRVHMAISCFREDGSQARGDSAAKCKVGTIRGPGEVPREATQPALK